MMVITDSSMSESTLRHTVNNGTDQNDILELTVCKENIIKIDYRPNGIGASPDTPMIDPNKVWDAKGFNIDETVEDLQ